MILKTDTVLLINCLLQYTGDTSLRYYIEYYTYLIDRSNIPNKCFCFVSGTYSIVQITIQRSKCTRKILKTCEYIKNLI